MQPGEKPAAIEEPEAGVARARSRKRADPSPAQPLHATRFAYLDGLPIAAAVLVRDREGICCVSVSNPMWDELSGRAVRSAADAGVDPIESHPGLRDRLSRFFASGRQVDLFEWSEEYRVTARHFTIQLSRLSPQSFSGPACLISLIDRTAEVESERSLRAEALHDGLTGLPNRLAFNDAIERALADDAQVGGFAVIVVDLRRFSRINESMGSSAGDELIVTVARRITSALRSGDVLARIGGDEFGILLRLTEGPGDTLHAARRLHEIMAKPFRLSEMEIRIDCAIGCALMADHAGGTEDMVRNAQVALKRAKESGRVEVYQPGEVVAARRRFSLETELRRAIENDALKLAFQPLIDLQTGVVAGFEALARWTHAEHGEISPTEFIPVAEESGLIVPLGRWALETATRSLREWDAALGGEIPAYMAVNVSAIQLMRDDVPKAVGAALERSGITGRRLTLELTESAIIRDPERATRALQGLKRLDTRIALDDFGTGYSSLAYLQRLPIDILKIDRSFVTGMLGDRDSVAIVRAVLSLADALGMQTTAEGVETTELAQTLAALGCSYGQGFYFSRPIDADAALAYWRANA